MCKYQPTIRLTPTDLNKLHRGRRHKTPLQRGQWLCLPNGKRGRYVRHARRGGLWIAVGDDRPYSVNIEFMALVSKARLLEPYRNQLSLV